ncbi:YnbE family lipoprotein [Oceanimonas baumannii]|uniref:YnbE family lipoprotein n=1 Tax=Oceanimonas baumannii TaxID=129578 RepID=A0A235CGX3_9GAMM|nr:YnbE family lipoprotein [Oceanimonas baumannii]MCC4264371.1 YnbE family lipoprotein [Oceanimonas baumannii]OYD23634.1 YnbE family lipoprotein [Oceanimonas baumannii]TDW55826.1 YnbE-like lipoprotein [Oceanimonas baumannii]
MKQTAMVLTGLLLTACTPRVEVVVPDKPITVNLNVKVDHEIRVRVDRELEKLFEQEQELF